MIEITKEGTPPGKIPMKGVCWSCKTEIKCLKEDCRAEDNFRDTSYYVQCPICHGTIGVKDA